MFSFGLREPRGDDREGEERDPSAAESRGPVYEVPGPLEPEAELPLYPLTDCLPCCGGMSSRPALGGEALNAW